MGTILASIQTIYAVMAVMPILPFVAVYFGYAAYKKDRKKGFRLAMDVTTFPLIGCVAVLFNEVFSTRFGFYGILLVLLIGGGLLGNLQYRSKGEVNAKRIARAVWRLSFFVMSAMYLLLMVIGIGQAFWKVI
ncbi:DUF3397 domain-containing protein [Paenibacillus tarimensis]|uniref:DUF3397 domain-containing protein n=1 Tax=Paenibacillus tarimensis TaxID=416012 RepID=UPI001F338B21|nr:DUF3397 domain-containing protein [Paenibacillus tarimensis]MCF2942102.1 DUF3397 domain-containing protein [Paenibacillus tarimensis]